MFYVFSPFILLNQWIFFYIYPIDLWSNNKILTGHGWFNKYFILFQTKWNQGQQKPTVYVKNLFWIFKKYSAPLIKIIDKFYFTEYPKKFIIDWDVNLPLIQYSRP